MSQAVRRPPNVTIAGALFAVHGIAVVVNAVISQDWTGGVESGSLPRALLRLAGTLLVGWGLLRGDTWAWWVGISLAILWLVGGFAPVLVLDRGDMHWLAPSPDQIVLVISLLSLTLALGLLCTPTARAFLHRGPR